MKNLTHCVLFSVFLSSIPASALSIIPPISEAQKIRESYRLFISSKKVALERLEKYGFMDIKNSGKHECFMNENVFGCSILYRYSFVMEDDVFTKVYYHFSSAYSSAKSSSISLSKDEKDEIIIILNMVTDDPKMSEEIINELVRAYHLKVANKERIGGGYSVHLNYRGMIIELTGNEEVFFNLYVN